MPSEYYTVRKLRFRKSAFQKPAISLISVDKTSAEIVKNSDSSSSVRVYLDDDNEWKGEYNILFAAVFSKRLLANEIAKINALWKKLYTSNTLALQYIGLILALLVGLCLVTSLMFDMLSRNCELILILLIWTLTLFCIGLHFVNVVHFEKCFVNLEFHLEDRTKAYASRGIKFKSFWPKVMDSSIYIVRDHRYSSHTIKSIKRTKSSLKKSKRQKSVDACNCSHSVCRALNNYRTSANEDS
eukprot:247705_1